MWQLVLLPFVAEHGIPWRERTDGNCHKQKKQLFLNSVVANRDKGHGVVRMTELWCPQMRIKWKQKILFVVLDVAVVLWVWDLPVGW